MPIVWQCTLIEPAKSIYRTLTDLERGDLLSLSFTPGFPLADIAESGPAIVAFGRTQPVAERAAAALAKDISGREHDFAGHIYGPDEAVQHAMAVAARAHRPVILADSQDNPRAGANSDGVDMLAALVRNGARGTVLAMIHDPQVAAAAHQAGDGATITVALGGKSGWPGHRPYTADFRVERLGDGVIEATGPFYRGNHMRLGPMALLSTEGVRVIVASRKQQAADEAMFRHLGVEPAAQKILVLKSSVHFRADFQPIAEAILIVAAPGPNPADHRVLTYRRL